MQSRLFCRRRRPDSLADEMQARLAVVLMTWLGLHMQKCLKASKQGKGSAPDLACQNL